MTTAQSLILRRDKAYINLTTAPYSLGRDFSVPTLAPSVGFATGSSANINGGSTRTSIKYNSRSWSFGIRVVDASEAAIRLAIRTVSQFLSGINDQNKTYIEWRGNSDTPEPLYGTFGAAFRYEVIDGTVSTWQEYADFSNRGATAFITLDLVIAPFAETKTLRAFTATGGIIEDNIGTLDGRSRGFIAAEATTNKMTNPVFGSATWSTGWTTGANLISSDNTNANWLPHSFDHSVRLDNIAASSDIFTQSINVGNTNKHSVSCYARLQDGGAISASQVSLYYSTALTTTYTSLGGGWYLLTADNFDGINAATDTGVTVAARQVVFVTGFQIEEKAYSTPLAHGDLLGCAWTGTAHASTSTRTVATCKITTADDSLRHGAWSMRLVVKTPYANTHSVSWHLFDARDGSHSTAPYLYYESAVDLFSLVYNGQSSNSATQSFSKGTTIVFHMVCTGSTVTLYVNGTASAASGTFAPVAFGANLFLGSVYNSTLQGNNTTRSFATFDVALTSTQVLNDYTNIAAALDNDIKIDTVPYLWTVGGDNVLALTASHQTLGVVGGVPGNMPAATEIKGVLSDNWSTIKSIALSNYPCDIHLGNIFFTDISTTAGAGDYGGQHLSTLVNGNAISLATRFVNYKFIKYLENLEYVFLTRLYGSAATSLVLYSNYSLGGGVFNSDDRTVTPATTYRLIYTSPHVFSTRINEFTGYTLNDITFILYGEKIATDVTISVDYFAIVPTPIFITGGDLASTGFSYKAMSAVQAYSYGVISRSLNVIGNVIEFAPNKVNHFQCYLCPDETVDPAITYTTTFSAIYLTPRWALL